MTLPVALALSCGEHKHVESDNPMNNPYWDEIKDRLDEVIDGLGWSIRTDKHIMDGLYFRRKDLCRKYAWAIPDPVTIAFVAEHLQEQAVEMGAGTGYFAWLLSQLGIDIIAYDSTPPDICTNNHYHSPRKDSHSKLLNQTREVYAPVLQGEPPILAQHADRTRPPYGESMAAECLEHYQGKRLVFIGEGEGGCTGDDVFFERLDKEWTPLDEHKPVQWDGLHDYVCVYQRVEGVAP